MPDEKINYIATAQDRASPTLKTLKKNVQSLGTKNSGPLGSMLGGIGPMGGALAVIGGATAAVSVLEGVGHWLGEGAASAIAEEAALKKLGTTLGNTIPGWHGTTDAIDKYITQGQALAFADDDLRSSFEKLVIRTHDAGEALDLLRLSQDLARGTGKDLGTAAELVGKAYSGQIGAVRRAGIAIDANATSTEALAVLTQTYSGQAKTYLQTTMGQGAATQVQMAELQEDIGSGLLPVLHDAATAGLGFATTMREGMTNVADSVSGLPATAQSMVPEFLRPLLGLPPQMEAAAAASSAAFEDSFRAGHAGEAMDRYLFPVEQAVKDLDLSDDMQTALDVGVVDTIHSASDKVDDAMADLMYAIEHPMEGMKEVARIEAALTGSELAAGLASANPLTRAQAERTQEILQEQWTAITGIAYDAGYDAQKAYNRGIRTAPRPEIQYPKYPVIVGGREVVTAHAAGGPIAPYETSWVGERGPELLTMGSRGGFVTPNHALQQESSGGHGHDIYLDGQKVGRAVDRQMGRDMSLSSGYAYVRG